MPLPGLQVVYGTEPSQAPKDRILEHSNQSDSINNQFGGSYVWLVPAFTTDASQALTGFNIAIQPDADPSLKNLADGTQGDFRYLILDQSLMPEAEPVTDVVLLRLGSEMTDRPAKWDGNTGNINKGRGGTYLYLLWKTA
ncbi:hypothetical protein GSI_08156 [Ganoderma sinense ZZ0214-1]|uniref:Uncharacterized protein n=1 Tax=Ganoderma sinense ZZ0214-1 TaxID=1077348 RepID=A0A2G8S863_9APHY|nr:hypothetical protein GSI_08156 [Ganoderma sinense ZZ0214-1]